MAEGLQYKENLTLISGGYPGENPGSDGVVQDWTETTGDSGSSTVTYHYNDSAQMTNANSTYVEINITDNWTATKDNRNYYHITVSTTINYIRRTRVGSPSPLSVYMFARHDAGGANIWTSGGCVDAANSGTNATNINMGTTTIDLAPGQSTNVHGTVYFRSNICGHNNAKPPSIYVDEFWLGVNFRNTLPPDYRPGKTWNGNEWLSHNRGAGSYISSKNLFDKNHLNSLNAYLSSNNTIVGPSNNDRVWWMECEPNTTYVVQRAENATQSANRFKLATTTTTPTIGASISNFVYLTDGTPGTVLSITTGSTAKYLCMQLYNASGSSTEADILSTVMVEKRGINLFNLYQNKPVGYTTNINGVDFTWLGNERWKLNGTATAQIDTAFYGGWGSTVDPAGFLGDEWRGQTFSSHIYKEDGTSGDNILDGHVWFFKNGASYWTRWGNSWSAPTDAGVNGIEVFLTVPNGRHVDDTFHIQVERGVTTPWVPYASPYEPYATTYFSAGATDIYTSATSKNTMRTQDGGVGTNNPPYTRHNDDTWRNQRKTGIE